MWVQEKGLCGGTRRAMLTVDFLQSQLLSLADKAEDHEPGDQVEAGVEADWNFELGSAFKRGV